MKIIYLHVYILKTKFYFQQKLLDWAATLPDEKPSQRLGFIKDFIGLCTQDELRRLKKMVQLTKRRNAKDSKFSKVT